MATLQEYKCPCCGGAISFDIEQQKMKCPYCDSEFEPESLRAFDEALKNEPQNQMEWEQAAGGSWQEGEEAQLRIYICNSCGGEIIAEHTTAASSCPYCNNPVIMTEQLSGVLKPDYVIPFQLDKAQAVEALKKHYSKKPLLPKVFKNENHIKEIQGLYVPFWLFDADADADLRYRATRITAWSDSEYHYTATSFYAVQRGGSLAFERVPVDGSSKMDDALMEAIEPFDFSAAVDFQTAYLAGYLADKYDVSSEMSIERANDRIRAATREAFRKTILGFATVNPEAESIRLENGIAKYALYPVWLLTTEWKGKNYTFAMNGQSGRIAGDLPMDRGAFWRWFSAIAAAAAALTFGISCLIWWMG